MNLTKHVNAFVRDEEGQDLIEYALLVALISLVCVVALTDAGTQGEQDLRGDQEQADDRCARRRNSRHAWRRRRRPPPTVRGRGMRARGETT